MTTNCFAITLLLTLVSCGDGVYHSVYDEPNVQDLISLTKSYYSVDSLPVHQIFLVPETYLENGCMARSVGGCNKNGLILVLNSLSPEYTCQTILHELNHSAAYMLRGDWDYSHTFNPSFYLDFVPKTCAKYNGKEFL